MKTARVFLVLALIGLLAACAPAATPAAPAGPATLTVMTHDSFAVSEDLIRQFEQDNHVTLVFAKSGDTGAAVNLAVLSKDAPRADVFYGVDNTFLSRALEAGIFEPYASPLLADIPAGFKLDPANGALPVDYGDVCINYDKAYFAGKGLAVPASLEEHDIAVQGFISTLSLTRSNRKDITLFVNGRWVQDAALTAAVIKAYNTMLMVGRYPVEVLFLNIAPELVDVNVHPSKAEVRFREPDRIFSTVQRTIRRALLAFTPVPQLDAVNLWGRGAASGGQPAPASAGAALPDVGGLSPAAGGGPWQPDLPGQRLPLLRLIGQVASTYLVAEGPDGLYLIDQHAAHERVLFDQMMAQYAASAAASQALVTPLSVELTPEKSALLEEQLPTLASLGFDLEPFGPGTFRIRAVPAIFQKGDPREAVLAVVNAFEEDETPLQSEVEARIAARVCKRMAVKGGQLLSDAEQRALLLDLESSPSPRTCPHGRPTMIHLSASLLERQFGRTGPR